MKKPTTVTWPIIATIIAFTTANPAFATPTTVLVAPDTTLRQADGSYLLGDLALSPGQWRIQEAPSGPSACCDGYRLISDSNAQTASFAAANPQQHFASFQTTVQFNGSQSEINSLWGWINAFSDGQLISSELFGGHYWSSLAERQTIEATIPSSADRIEIIPRVNLGYTAFTFTLNAVPEPSSIVLFACGLALLFLQSRRKSRHSNETDLTNSAA